MARTTVSPADKRGGNDSVAEASIQANVLKALRKVIIIHKLEEIPGKFAAEDEEREWGATHDFSDSLRKKLQTKSSEANIRLSEFKQGRQTRVR